jgi:hypothetical protein
VGFYDKKINSPNLLKARGRKSTRLISHGVVLFPIKNSPVWHTVFVCVRIICKKGEECLKIRQQTGIASFEDWGPGTKKQRRSSKHNLSPRLTFNPADLMTASHCSFVERGASSNTCPILCQVWRSES